MNEKYMKAAVRYLEAHDRKIITQTEHGFVSYDDGGMVFMWVATDTEPYPSLDEIDKEIPVIELAKDEALMISVIKFIRATDDRALLKEIWNYPCSPECKKTERSVWIVDIDRNAPDWMHWQADFPVVFSTKEAAFAWKPDKIDNEPGGYLIVSEREVRDE